MDSSILERRGRTRKYIYKIGYIRVMKSADQITYTWSSGPVGSPKSKTATKVVSSRIISDVVFIFIYNISKNH